MTGYRGKIVSASWIREDSGGLSDEHAKWSARRSIVIDHLGSIRYGRPLMRIELVLWDKDPVNATDFKRTSSAASAGRLTPGHTCRRRSRPSRRGLRLRNLRRSAAVISLWSGCVRWNVRFTKTGNSSEDNFLVTS